MDNDDMSDDDNDSKLNLDKDDEDLSDSFDNPYTEMKSNKEDKVPRSPPGAPKIGPKKPPKIFDFLNSYFSLFGKHERSFDSSNSSDSSKVAKKKKKRVINISKILYRKSDGKF